MKTPKHNSRIFNIVWSLAIPLVILITGSLITGSLISNVPTPAVTGNIGWSPGTRTAILWQVGTSATPGTTSVFMGTIVADQSIPMNTGALIDGRLPARSDPVTVPANTILKPTP